MIGKKYKFFPNQKGDQMVKRILTLCLLSKLALGVAGDPVELQVTNLRSMRTSEKMLALLKTISQYVTEPLVRNGDQELWPDDYRGNFGKSLAWNSTTFHKDEYLKLLDALASEKSADFDALLGGAAPSAQAFKLVNPQAAFAFDYNGADQWGFSIPPAPALKSAEAAGEMVEVYWHAILRDVNFNKYTTDVNAGKAVTGMNALSDFKGPKVGGNVTGGTLFRGVWPGELDGPYISQFLYLPIPYGPGANWNGSGSLPTAYQEFATPTAGSSNNFMTDEVEWENIQRGRAPAESITFAPGRTFIRNARDLGEYVHNDTPAQLAADTALILLSFGPDAMDPNMYYLGNPSQNGFVTFGPVSVIIQVCKAVELALKAAWFQKWFVHRRLRPEVFGYLIEHEGTLNTGLHSDIMNASFWTDNTLPVTFGSNKLLPMAYPEGSPCHPAYPAGHATLAGAVATVLKAFFKEDFVIPAPVQPNSDNDALEACPDELTIGGELNKLASNISIGRNMAGVHYRTDGTEGMLLGEKVAINYLKALGATYHEPFQGFSFTKFDGTVVTGLGAKSA